MDEYLKLNGKSKGINMYVNSDFDKAAHEVVR